MTFAISFRSLLFYLSSSLFGTDPVKSFWAEQWGVETYSQHLTIQAKQSLNMDTSLGAGILHCWRQRSLHVTSCYRMISAKWPKGLYKSQKQRMNQNAQGPANSSCVFETSPHPGPWFKAIRRSRLKSRQYASQFSQLARIWNLTAYIGQSIQNSTASICQSSSCFLLPSLKSFSSAIWAIVPFQLFRSRLLTANILQTIDLRMAWDATRFLNLYSSKRGYQWRFKLKTCCVVLCHTTTEFGIPKFVCTILSPWEVSLIPTNQTQLKWRHFLPLVNMNIAIENHRFEIFWIGKSTTNWGSFHSNVSLLAGTLFTHFFAFFGTVGAFGRPCAGFLKASETAIWKGRTNHQVRFQTRGAWLQYQLQLQ